VITPRRTRLLRVPSLRGLRDVLTGTIAGLDAGTAADTFVLVPTRAAAEQLRRTVEDRVLVTRPVLFWPIAGPRADFYREIGERAPASPPLLSSFDREVLLGRLARTVAGAGVEPPFALRPAILAEMLTLYDLIRRQARSVADFDRNLRAELEPAAGSDRGAAQLLRQTTFLAAVFVAYERHLTEAGLFDEHRLRTHVLGGGALQPLRHIVVSVGDRVADADGLWPVDFTLLSMLPGLTALDVIATEGVLAAGFLERVHAVLPGLEEVTDAGAPHRDQATVSVPRLMISAPDMLVASARDREDELAGVARRIKARRRRGDATPLSRQALIVRRPLPYLYLARSVFGGAGIPFETLDTLPLAAEPYAAALDLVLDAPISAFSRTSLVALLRSPHFGFDRISAELTAETVSAFDRALADARYLGGLDRLLSFEHAWAGEGAGAGKEGGRRRRAAPALVVAAAIARELSGLADRRPVLLQLDTIQQFLARHDRQLAPGGSDRRARVRGAVVGALASLARAYAAHDPDVEASGAELSSTIRRWLGAQTFAARTGDAGIRVLDAQAAKYIDVDDVQLLGLVEGEWPEPVRRSIFYPPVLLGRLEPTPAADDPNRRESEAMAAARAAFLDLMMLPRQRVRASTFALEADAVVEPSPFVDDLGALGFQIEVDGTDPSALVFAEEALLAAPPVLHTLPPLAREWSAVRQLAPLHGDRRYLGEAGAWQLPRVSVSRIDRYLKCPFQFFASDVLGLEEEPEDGDLPPPWERGRFLHAIFESFFREWQHRGHGRITPGRVGEARSLLVEISERALAALPPQEAALERPRLYGSAVSAGIIDRVLTMEAERAAPVERRLIEFELDAPFSFRSPGETPPREVRLRAKIDRVDLLEGGGFRVIDYKSRLVPDPKRTVQLQVYTAAVAQQLRRGGDPRQPSEAFYLSLEGDSAVKALRPAKGQSLDDVLKDAEQRMVQAMDDMAAGHFPARPRPRSLCAQCPFDAVCRKAFVEPSDE
jgi:RecB family exonuclease